MRLESGSMVSRSEHPEDPAARTAIVGQANGHDQSTVPPAFVRSLFDEPVEADDVTSEEADLDSAEHSTPDHGEAEGLDHTSQARSSAISVERVVIIDGMPCIALRTSGYALVKVRGVAQHTDVTLTLDTEAKVKAPHEPMKIELTFSRTSGTYHVHIAEGIWKQQTFDYFVASKWKSVVGSRNNRESRTQNKNGSPCPTRTAR